MGIGLSRPAAGSERGRLPQVLLGLRLPAEPRERQGEVGVGLRPPGVDPQGGLELRRRLFPLREVVEPAPFIV